MFKIFFIYKDKLHATFIRILKKKTCQYLYSVLFRFKINKQTLPRLRKQTHDLIN